MLESFRASKMKFPLLHIHYSVQNSVQRKIIYALFACGLLGPSAIAQSGVGRGTDAEINALVTQLSDPSYAKRVGATRRLCAIGAPATEALTGAASGKDMETALRAKKILQALHNLWFSGVDVRLECSQQTFEWDHPIEIRLIMENRSNYPAQ